MPSRGKMFGLLMLTRVVGLNICALEQNKHCFIAWYMEMFLYAPRNKLKTVLWKVKPCVWGEAIYLRDH
jgi:hypothetical protein